MPYISQDSRPLFNPTTETTPGSPGGLNYQLTMLCNEYLQRNSLGYFSINDVIGALECCKLEFYRRVAAPYEDKKIIENGDVY